MLLQIVSITALSALTPIVARGVVAWNESREEARARDSLRWKQTEKKQSSGKLFSSVHY